MRQAIKNLDYTTRDYEGFRTLMLQKLTELMPEYTDLRQSDAGVVIIELNAMCLDILSYYLDSIANECFLATAEQRSSVMKFCKMLGYTPRAATSAVHKLIFRKTNPTTSITIPSGTKVKTVSSNPNNVVYFTTLEPLTLAENISGDELDFNGKYMFTVEAIQGLFVNDELVENHANGAANQRYALKYFPVLIQDTYKTKKTGTVVDILSVYVADLEHGEASQKWQRVKSFAGANSTSQVYMTETNDYNETSIVFGDGVFGKKPPEGALITCSYVVGGGEVGNVGLGSIKALEDNLAGIKNTENVEIVEYGSEAETVDEIKINAPVSHRNIWGALTVNDFAGLIKATFGSVEDAEAKRASDDNWDTLRVDDIKIYVQTKDEVAYAEAYDVPTIPDSWYVNNETYSNIISSISAFFDSDTDYVDVGSDTVADGARKIAGTRNIILTHPNYYGLKIEYVLMVRSYYDYDTIAESVEQYIKDYFKVGNIMFTQEISLQELTYQILDDSGIEGIRYLNLKLTDLQLDLNGEYSDNYMSYLNSDLIIPKKGTIFVLDSIEAKEE